MADYRERPRGDRLYRGSPEPCNPRDPSSRSYRARTPPFLDGDAWSEVALGNAGNHGLIVWDRYFYLGGPGGDGLGCN